jgi:hypothetical protein
VEENLEATTLLPCTVQLSNGHYNYLPLYKQSNKQNNAYGVPNFSEGH